MKQFDRSYGFKLLCQRAVLRRLILTSVVIVRPGLYRIEIMYAYVLILRFEIDPSQIFELFADGSGEKHSLNTFREVFHDLLEGVLETHVEQAVHLVENQHLQVTRVETL